MAEQQQQSQLMGNLQQNEEEKKQETNQIQNKQKEDQNQKPLNDNNNNAEEEDNQDDQLDQALEGLDEEINVTQDEKEEEENEDPQVEKEFEDLMKSMQQGFQGMGGGGGEDNMENFGKMFETILKGGFPDQEKQQNGQQASNNKEEEGDALDNPQFDQLANMLLNQFMDKDILLEPLQDAQKNYIQYLQENKSKISEIDHENYQNQLKCINNLLDMIQKNPENKDQMIQEFENMQQYGQPPESLLQSFGGGQNLFSMFGQMQQGQGQQQQQQQKKKKKSGQDQIPNLDDPNCIIF